MSDDDSDLEGYWKDLRNTSTVQAFSGRVSNIREGVEVAALKAREQLTQKLQAKKGSAQSLTAENMAEWIMLGVQLFVEEWEASLRRKDVSSLVEIVLESRTLSLTELKGFVRALPASLIDRVVAEGNTSGKATGIHALLAFEFNYRKDTSISRGDYVLERDPKDNGLVIVSYPRQLGGDPLRFRLDENFNLDAGPGVER